MCNCGGSFRQSISSAKKPSVKAPSVVDMKNRILSLWKGVLNNESYSKTEFIKIYLQRFPQNKYLTEVLSKENLHKMYVDLTH